MKKVFFVFLFIACFIFNSNAQEYKTGIGFRGGWTSGLTIKHFIKEGKAIEGILSSGWGWRGYQITGLYEVHKAAFADDDVEGLYWFYGAGLHFGGGYTYYQDVWIYTGPGNSGYWRRDRYNYYAFGIDGIFGMEYKIPDIPFTVGLDIKPFIEFTNYSHAPFNFWDGALSVRFAF